MFFLWDKRLQYETLEISDLTTKRKQKKKSQANLKVILKLIPDIPKLMIKIKEKKILGKAYLKVVLKT